MNDCVIFERKSKSENLVKGIIHNVFCVIQLKFTCRCRSDFLGLELEGQMKF